MLQNARVTTFTVSELLRETQQGGWATPHPPRLDLKRWIFYFYKVNEFKHSPYFSPYRWEYLVLSRIIITLSLIPCKNVTFSWDGTIDIHKWCLSLLPRRSIHFSQVDSFVVCFATFFSNWQKISLTAQDFYWCKGI